jgi:hypothetical protein
MKVSLRLFQKRVVRTRFDIYCFSSNNVFIYIPAETFGGEALGIDHNVGGDKL